MDGSLTELSKYRFQRAKEIIKDTALEQLEKAENVINLVEEYLEKRWKL